MVGDLRNSSVTEKIKCKKIDKYFLSRPQWKSFKIFTLLH